MKQADPCTADAADTAATDRPTSKPAITLVIVSGLSGAGKTVALKQYEDLGYDCIDNLPLPLLGPATRRALRSLDGRSRRLAIGVDARADAEQIRRFPQYLQRLHARGVQTRVLFLRADEATLLQRYSETRRCHPLAHGGLSLIEAIRAERNLLAPIANLADATIDTTHRNLYELREDIRTQIPGGGAGKLVVQFESFGFRNGVPGDADFVFDIRCLPNPHWQPALRRHSGLDTPVAQWFSTQPQVARMIEDLLGFLRRWLPEYRKQDRAYLTIAIGCTGGQHRSVYVVEQLARALRDECDQLNIRHRDLAVDRRPVAPSGATAQ